MATKKTTLSWSDVKIKLADFDRAGLISLVQDLYAANKDNQTFLHARFGLGGDVLKPYKATIDRWLWPDMFKNQDTSVSKAKKAISDYKKAVGQSDELAELMVFYCERAAGFSDDIGLQDEGYFDALVRMFEQALKIIAALPNEARSTLLQRLDELRRISHNLVTALAMTWMNCWPSTGSMTDSDVFAALQAENARLTRYWQPKASNSGCRRLLPQRFVS